jgi:hypothetical protein
LVGTASGFNNLSVLIGGAVFQPLVGIWLQYFEGSTGKLSAGASTVHAYSLASYNKALFILPCSYLLSMLIIIFVLKESHPAYTGKLHVATE